jgi:hypothetical protein
MGAVQSQDYPAAKWALGLRTPDTTDREVDDAFNRGAILRTHVLRPTWHFVSPADIRWMLELTSPRVKVATGSFYRKMEVGERLIARSNGVLARALEGGRHATRASLTATLQQARVIRTGEDPLRVLALFMRAELDGLICSGPRQGRQFTYALLAERVTPGPSLTMEEARAALAARYFESHGPATLRDFRWWSGLTAGEARAGVEAVANRLTTIRMEDEVYWQPDSRPRAAASPGACLLPVFDEALLSYRDCRVVSRTDAHPLERDYGRTIVVDGQPMGTWNRTVRKQHLLVTAHLFRPPGRKELRAIHAAAARYGRFMELPVRLDMSVAGRAALAGQDNDKGQGK